MEKSKNEDLEAFPPSPTTGDYGDAAVLGLSSPVSSPAVRLATTPPPAGGTGGTIVGWGKQSAAEEGASSQLRFGSTVVQSPGYCEEQVGSTFHPLGELCSLDYPTYQSALARVTAAVLSWPWSPGTSEYVEAGITSHGPEGCPTNRPRVDTRADFVASRLRLPLPRRSRSRSRLPRPRRHRPLSRFCPF